jgi:hypothetical protein
MDPILVSNSFREQSGGTMSSETARRPDLGGQLLLEIEILRSLCLTVNSDGSEIKYRILEALVEEDFYFPVTRTIFAAVSQLHRNGDQVVAKSLQQVLNERSVDVPDDFYVEDLFRGELASLPTLMEWIERLKAAEDPRPSRPPLEPDDLPRLEKTQPSVKSPPSLPKTPPPPPASDVGTAASPAAPLSAEASAVRPEKDVLTPESGQWLGFLAELTRKQGERLKTGFPHLDAEWGGLLPGLFLIASEDRDQLLDFLKQLVDQIAVECRGPCLYLSFERSKAALRLQTLSRLSGAPAADIEKGRFGKDSAKWQDIVRAGEQAVEWLQRIYVVETRPGLSVTGIRELRQGLLDAGAGAPRLVAVDNLEKLANQSDLLQSVAELKELAETFGIVVVGAATEMEIVHERSADLAATFHGADGHTEMKLTSAGAAAPRVARFNHHRESHRFEERPRGA